MPENIKLHLIADRKKVGSLEFGEVAPMVRTGEYIYSDGKSWKVNSIVHTGHNIIAMVTPERCPDFPYDGMTDNEILGQLTRRFRTE